MFNLIPKQALVFYEPNIDELNDYGLPLEIPVDVHTVIFTHSLNEKGEITSTTSPNATQVMTFLEKNLSSTGLDLKKPFIKGSTNDKILAWKYEKDILSLVWWTEQRVVHLETSSGFIDYLFPKLIFIYNGGIQIYAIKKLKGKETQLYNFSLPHLSNGSLCLGSVTPLLEKILKETHDLEQIAISMESAIFTAKFTHPFSNLDTIKRSVEEGKYKGKLTKISTLYEKAKRIYD